MADNDNNKPRGREKNVTGAGKGVYRRGEGLGTGKVGTGSGVPGGGSGSSGSPKTGAGRPQSGGTRPSKTQYGRTDDSYDGGSRSSGTRSRSASGVLPIILVLLFLLVFGGKGTLSSLFSGLGGGAQTQTPTNTPQQTQTQTVQPLSQLTPVANMFSNSAQQVSSGTSSTPTSSSSAANNVAAASNWNLTSNNGVLNRNVSSAARSKFTSILGNGRDTVTIMAFAAMSPDEAASHKPTVVILSDGNKSLKRL